MNDLVDLSAVELAERIARRQVSSAEVFAAHIERIREVDVELNAVVVERFAAALAEAQRADRMLDGSEPVGPLHGVPVTVKESLDLAGMPSTFGIPSRAGIPAARDDTSPSCAPPTPSSSARRTSPSCSSTARATTRPYMLIAIQLEERDLVHYHGEAYERYRETTPMLLPMPGWVAPEAELVALDRAREDAEPTVKPEPA